MSLPKWALLVVCGAALLAGCQSEQSVPPVWAKLVTEPEPDKDVKPPSWYTPLQEPEPWKLEAEPAFGTDAWRQWCALRFNPRAVLPELKAAPVIDGDLGDAVWKNAALKKPFVSSNGSPSSPATTVYVAYDKSTLYIGIRAAEPALGQVRARTTRRDLTAHMLQDDRIEIRLAPDWRNNTFARYWLMVNKNGALVDGMDSNTGWNPKVTVKTPRQETKQWSVELALPLDDLGLDGRDPWGEVWAFSVVRHRYAGGPHEVSSWTRPIDVQAGSAEWGHLLFKGIKPPAKPPVKDPAPKTGDATKKADDTADKTGKTGEPATKTPDAGKKTDDKTKTGPGTDAKGGDTPKKAGATDES